jgi:hypothetical protein
MFKFRLLTFCTVPHAAQLAPTICANLRWQPLQWLMVGPDAISLIVSGGMSTISKRLEAVSFWRKTSSSRRIDQPTALGNVLSKRNNCLSSLLNANSLCLGAISTQYGELLMARSSFFAYRLANVPIGTKLVSAGRS